MRLHRKHAAEQRTEASSFPSSRGMPSVRVHLKETMNILLLTVANSRRTAKSGKDKQTREQRFPITLPASAQGFPGTFVFNSPWWLFFM